MSTMISRENFKRAVSFCREYDPFTQYIESYQQMENAREYNRALDKAFMELMLEIGIECNGIPWECENAGKETENKLAKWLAERNVEIEAEKKRVWSEDEIKNLIQTNDEVLYRALKKLYECQTTDEKRSGCTKEYNGKGFNSVDAKFMTSVSEFLIKVGYLTEKQKVATRKVIIKYTKQLTRIANN